MWAILSLHILYGPRHPVS